MTNIEFYFDPSCPWCWVTSRWLVEVQEQREMSIEWKPFSLAMKNEELNGDDPTGHRDAHMEAHRITRMIEAIHEAEDTDRGVLYSAFSKARFVDNLQWDEQTMASLLKDLDISQKYLAKADDTALDAKLEQHLNDAIAIVGSDVGVPLIVFTNEQSEKQGYFGPVLQGLPDTEEGLKLWDGLALLASSKHFYELKRSRKGGALPGTTARVFND